MTSALSVCLGIAGDAHDGGKTCKDTTGRDPVTEIFLLLFICKFRPDEERGDGDNPVRKDLNARSDIAHDEASRLAPEPSNFL